MSQKLKITLLTIPTLILVSWLVIHYSHGAFPASSCTQDTEISNETRETLEHASKNFLIAFINGNVGEAYRSMTESLQSTITKEQLSKLQFPANAGNVQDILSLQHTYFIQTSGKSDSGVARMVCANKIRNDPTVVSITNAPQQAYVLFDATMPDSSTMGFTLWLVREGDTWKIGSFSELTDKLDGQGPRNFLELAKGEAKKHHDFNATVLFGAAIQLAYRGQNFEPAIVDEILDETKSLHIPEGLKGKAPFYWDDNDKVYKILKIGPLPQNNRFYLGIDFESNTWYNHQQIEDRNKGLTEYVKRTFPEYKSFFGGIIVRAHERGGEREFGTIDDDSGQAIPPKP